eukprot:6126657-Amphidinium_carterae.1
MSCFKRHQLLRKHIKDKYFSSVQPCLSCNTFPQVTLPEVLKPAHVLAMSGATTNQGTKTA